MDLYDQSTANMRLHNCIIRIENTPIWISHIDARSDGYLLRYNLLGRDRENIIFFSDESINITPVPLGFVNYRETIVNALRYPARTYKIGLCSSNFTIISIGKEKNALHNTERLIKSLTLNRTIIGEYPSMKKAIKELATHSHRAFSRDFAVRSDGTLIHRFAGIVGSVGAKKMLFDKHFYLQESLELVT